MVIVLSNCVQGYLHAGLGPPLEAGRFHYSLYIFDAVEMDRAFRALITPSSLSLSLSLSLRVPQPGMSMKPGPVVDSPSTTPHTRGLSNLSAPPQTRGPVQGPPSLPPQPVMQVLPPRVPPTLPSHAPQLGAPYSMGPSMDCIPQVHVMAPLPPPTQTTPHLHPHPDHPYT